MLQSASNLNISIQRQVYANLENNARFEFYGNLSCRKYNRALQVFYRLQCIKVPRYRFSGSIPPKSERKLRRHKQRFGKIDAAVVLGKDETLI